MPRPMAAYCSFKPEGTGCREEGGGEVEPIETVVEAEKSVLRL